MDNQQTQGVQNAKFNGPAFVKRLVIFAVAVIVFIASLLPTVCYKATTYGDDSPIKVKISPWRSVVLMFDSFYNQDYDDFDDSLFAETAEVKMELYYEILEDADEDDLTLRERNTLAKVALLYIRAELRQEDSRAWLPFVIAGLISLAYIAFAIIFFIKALKSFIGFFKGAGESRSTAVMLCAVPFAAGLKLFAVKAAMYETGIFEGAKTLASFGVVLTIVLSCLAIAGIAVFAILFEGRRFSLKRDVSRLATLTVLIFAITTLAMPLMTLKVTGNLGDSSREKTAKVKYGSDYFGSLDLTEDEKENYEDMDDIEFFDGEESFSYGYQCYDKDGERLDPEDCLFDSYGLYGIINTFDDDSAKEYEEGENRTNVDYKLERLFAYSGGYKIFGLMNLIPLLAFVCIFALCVMAWRQLWCVVSNEHKPVGGKIDTVMAIISAASALLILILAIVFISTTLGDIREYLGRKAPENIHVALKLTLGMGPILTLIISAAFAALSFVPKASGMLAELENSAPNISYAPLFKKKAQAPAPAAQAYNPPAQGYQPQQPPQYTAPTQAYQPQPQQAPQYTAPAQDAAMVAGELKQYKELLDSGVITQADFDAKKAEILNLPKNQ